MVQVGLTLKDAYELLVDRKMTEQTSLLSEVKMANCIFCFNYYAVAILITLIVIVYYTSHFG